MQKNKRKWLTFNNFLVGCIQNDSDPFSSFDPMRQDLVIELGVVTLLRLNTFTDHEDWNLRTLPGIHTY